jgi:hypothetical protein
MDLETFGIISNISTFSVLLPLFVFFIAIYKKNQPYTVKVLGVLLVIAALSDFLSAFLHAHFKINPNPIVSAYVLLQFITLSLIYKSSYTRRWNKWMTNVVNILFTLFALINFFFVQGVYGFNSYSFAVSSVIFIIYAFLFSYQVLLELPERHIERTFMFWVNSAVFFYFGTNLYLFATVDQLLSQQDISQFLLSWAMHNGSNTLKNIMFTIALVVALLNRDHLTK